MDLNEIKNNKPQRPVIYYYLIALVVLLLLNFALVPWLSEKSIEETSYSEFLDELEAGSYIVRYKTVATSRFDSTSFKKTYEDLYKAFLKQSTSRRFSISY